MKHVARKRFGQHFLVDRSVIAATVAAIAPQRGDHLVEIGPGLGALTDALIGQIDRLLAVELDRDLAARLRQRYGPERLTLIEADVLTVPFDSPPFGTSLRVAGNLPYNISSPLLVHLLDVLPRVRDQHFMLQKEVVERIVAGPGTSAYGRLGVLLQAYYDMELLFEVGPESFDPPPRVDSAVIRMIPLAQPAPVPPQSLAKVLAPAFAQRRKMLRNTFIPWLAQQGVDTSALSPTDRAEDVPVSVYVALAGALQARGATAAG